MYSKLQKHTIDIYNLTQYEYEIVTIPARDLLKPQRLDLFAKLFYIRNYELKRDLGLKVYTEHIRAFNPDYCEPGRDDKVCLEDFISTFDNLINHFKDNDFDPSISYIPVSEDYTILDGAHRVAVLSYYGKDVKILRFKGISPKCAFDYNYFKKRGIATSTLDLIVSEVTRWIGNNYVACLWPRIGGYKEKNRAIDIISSMATPYYVKSVSVNIRTFVRFIANVYGHQDWVGDEKTGYIGAKDKAKRCFARNKQIYFVYFNALDLIHVIKLKEQIRNQFQYDKDSIHITDTDDEVKQLNQLILSCSPGYLFNASDNLLMYIKDRISDCIYYLKNIVWLDIKVWIASHLK